MYMYNITEPNLLEKDARLWERVTVRKKEFIASSGKQKINDPTQLKRQTILFLALYTFKQFA